MIKFDVHNRWTGDVQFTAEIDCAEDASRSFKLGLAVRAAVRAGANLTGAYLTGANLAGANLAGSYLEGAYLGDADLSGADLAGAHLSGANLAYADLAGADLAYADLSGANLARADLAGADLAYANLTGAKSAKTVIAKTRILPEGALIGWKKCKGDVLVKLRIPEEAARSHAFGRKCRAEFADVLEVTGADVGIAKHDSKTEYRVGERVTCHEWEPNWQMECAGGIHFFITRQEAEEWQ